LLKECCRRECAESKRFKYLEVFEELPQRVRAGFLLKTQVVVKDQEGYSLRGCQREAKEGWCLEVLKEGAMTLFAGGQVS
jgi:hypothetical protein